MEEEKKERKIPLFVQIVASLWILVFCLLKFFCNGNEDSDTMFVYTVDEVVKSGIGFMMCYSPEFIMNILDKFSGGKK